MRAYNIAMEVGAMVWRVGNLGRGSEPRIELVSDSERWIRTASTTNAK
jgi:hypothetical protein